MIYDDDDDDDGPKEDGTRLISSIHLVCQYVNLTYDAALDLPVDLFRNILRQAIIAELCKTTKGYEAVKTWRRMQNTEFDDGNFDAFKRFM